MGLAVLGFHVGGIVKFGTSLLFLGVLLSGCSFAGIDDSVSRPVFDLDHPSSVSELAWEWEAEDDVDSLDLAPVVGGVAVFDGTGVTIISGDTGELRWDYHPDHGRVIGSVTSDGGHVVIQEPDPENTGGFRMHVLDVVTGKTSWMEAFNSADDKVQIGGNSEKWTAPSLAQVDVGDKVWFLREDSEVVARSLGDERQVWSTSEVQDCSGVGSVGSPVLLDEVLLGAVTCYEFDQDDPENDPLYDSGAEFTSEVVAWDASDGREIWRLETPEVSLPVDSRNRSLTVHPGGIVSVDFSSWGMGYWIDPISEEHGWIEDAGVVSSYENGDQFGIWRNGEYRVVNRSGEVLYSVNEPAERDAPLALAEGMVRVSENVEGGSEGAVFARFHGSDQEVELSMDIDEQALMEFGRGAVVPGSVAIPFTDREGVAVSWGSAESEHERARIWSLLDFRTSAPKRFLLSFCGTPVACVHCSDSDRGFLGASHSAGIAGRAYPVHGHPAVGA
ncbi:PQQ-binding-like beta-propeller repeat protein (plasmid) [Nocardiopsis eucommiae]|uniref:PQQ-binding-like beta-propeller repeat protein n=1 Tax=Nocardiopsis eucommiae TaxID=2831970 RepID=A0A975QL75_9ACTN|nr:PQQ-binding-like beta-propeller repeat protein [Nocardiopsis eucommiae]